jgi:hypothetical protein
MSSAFRWSLIPVHRHPSSTPKLPPSQPSYQSLRWTGTSTLAHLLMRSDRIHPKSPKCQKPAQVQHQRMSHSVNPLSTSFRHLTYSRNHLPNPQQFLHLPKLELRLRQRPSPHLSLKSLRLKWRRVGMHSQYLQLGSMGLSFTPEMLRHRPNPLPPRLNPETPLELLPKALRHPSLVLPKTPNRVTFHG